MSLPQIIPELVWRDDAIVGESPNWCVKHQVLFWVDIRGQKVQRFDPAMGTNIYVPLDDLATSVNWREKGGFVVTLRKEFAFLDWETGDVTRLGDPEPERPGNRFNEARTDAKGRLWAGTMGDKEWDSPCGALYRLDADLTWKRMRDGIICANGTGWSPDSRTMYHTESFGYAIYAYDFDLERGEIENRRVLVQLDPSAGEFPDGMTVDAEGFIWSAHVGKGRIVRYDPEGKPEREIQLPVTRPTSCKFAGPDFRTLYITTARETLTPEQLAQEPLAGSLFACVPGVQGLPVKPFAG